MWELNPHTQNLPIDPSLLDGGDLVLTSSGVRPDVIKFGTALPTAPNLNTALFTDLKNRYFGANDFGARELVFRYAVFGDFSAVRTEASALNPSGPGVLSIPLIVEGGTSDTLVSQYNLDVDLDGDVDILAKPGDMIYMVNGSAIGDFRSIQDVEELTDPVTGNIALSFRVNYDWDVLPSIGSQFVIMPGYGGISELVRVDETGHRLSGNDMIISTAYYGPDAFGILGTFDKQWRVLAHEFGHTLGLVHSGREDALKDCAYRGDDHWSLMSYTHSSRITVKQPHTNWRRGLSRIP